LLMLVGEYDLMVPRIAMMKALQREATAAPHAPETRQDLPVHSLMPRAQRASPCPDVRSAVFTGHTKRTPR
jgi:hypothetical protein